MHRAPNPSNILILTQNLLRTQPLILRPIVLQQHLRPLQHNLHIHVPHAHRFLAAVDVIRLDDRVVVWSRADAELALRVCFGEGGEEGGGEEAVHAG